MDDLEEVEPEDMDEELEIEAPPYVRTPDTDPIFTLVRSGSPEEIIAYLEEYPDKIDLRHDRTDCYANETPLHTAAEAGRAEIVNLLMARGSQSILAMTNWHISVIFCAVKSQKLETVRTVLKWIPPGQEKIVGKGCVFGITPLHEAISKGCNDIVRGLISYFLQHRTRLKRFLHAYADGGSPLHYAIQDRNIWAIKYLLLMGANVNQEATEVGQPLDCCLVQKSKIDLDLVRLLRAFGATSRSLHQPRLSRLPIAAQNALTEPITSEMILAAREQVSGCISLTQILFDTLEEFDWLA